MEFAERLLASRRGSTIVGIAAAVLAGLLLLVYLNRYRSSVKVANETISVLVAKGTIHKGTPGDVVGSDQLYQPTDVAKSEVVNGALTTAASLRGRVAVADIYNGQQLTAADFKPVASGAIGNELTRDLRAISVPLDSAHGLIGDVHEGDHVDVFAGFTVASATGGGEQPVLKLLMQKALVLSAPAFAHIEYYDLNAADNGKVWLVLRPEGRVAATKPSLVTVQSLLFGVKPVIAYRNVHRLLGGIR